MASSAKRKSKGSKASDGKRKRKYSGSDEDGPAFMSSKYAGPPTSKIYNNRLKHSTTPDQLFRADLISAMKMPDSEPLAPDEYVIIEDPWRTEWEKGVQVPVNPDALPEPSFRILRKRNKDAHHKLPKKLIRFTRDSLFDPEIHVMSYANTYAEQICRYDMDNVDFHWLTLLNQDREDYGIPPLEENFFEQVIQELEVQAYVNFQEAIKSEEGLGVEYDEDAICDVCRSPDSLENNEMVFCDSCNICVHQICYGITKIPEGSWICRTCALGIRPACVLCPNRGGAMKTIRCGQKWAHVGCAVWIPGVSFFNFVKMEPIIKISQIPASRWALVCSLCNKKTGACIQCSEKGCKVAFHVTCAFNEGLQMRASVKSAYSDDDELKAFCRKHSKRPGLFSDSEELNGKRDSLSSEERATLRQQKILEKQAEFYNYVNIDDIAEHFQCDRVDIEAIYNYWKLKRRSNENHPLLTPKIDTTQNVLEEEEDSPLNFLKKLVLHRRDLERARNLCYMVKNREKLAKKWIQAKEEIFNYQLAILNKESKKLSEDELNAVINANSGDIAYDKKYSGVNGPSPNMVSVLTNLVGEDLTRTKFNSTVKLPKKNDNRNSVKTPNPYAKHYLNGLFMRTQRFLPDANKQKRKQCQSSSSAPDEKDNSHLQSDASSSAIFDTSNVSSDFNQESNCDCAESTAVSGNQLSDSSLRNQSDKQSVFIEESPRDQTDMQSLHTEESYKNLSDLYSMGTEESLRNRSDRHSTSTEESSRNQSDMHSTSTEESSRNQSDMHSACIEEKCDINSSTLEFPEDKDMSSSFSFSENMPDSANVNINSNCKNVNFETPFSGLSSDASITETTECMVESIDSGSGIKIENEDNIYVFNNTDVGTDLKIDETEFIYMPDLDVGANVKMEETESMNVDDYDCIYNPYEIDSDANVLVEECVYNYDSDCDTQSDYERSSINCLKESLCDTANKTKIADLKFAQNAKFEPNICQSRKMSVAEELNSLSIDKKDENNQNCNIIDSVDKYIEVKCEKTLSSNDSVSVKDQSSLPSKAESREKSNSKSIRKLLRENNKSFKQIKSTKNNELIAYKKESNQNVTKKIKSGKDFEISKETLPLKPKLERIDDSLTIDNVVNIDLNVQSTNDIAENSNIDLLENLKLEVKKNNDRVLPLPIVVLKPEDVVKCLKEGDSIKCSKNENGIKSSDKLSEKELSNTKKTKVNGLSKNSTPSEPILNRKSKFDKALSKNSPSRTESPTSIKLAENCSVKSNKPVKRKFNPETSPVFSKQSVVKLKHLNNISASSVSKLTSSSSNKCQDKSKSLEKQEDNASSSKNASSISDKPLLQVPRKDTFRGYKIPKKPQTNKPEENSLDLRRGNTPLSPLPDIATSGLSGYKNKTSWRKLEPRSEKIDNSQAPRTSEMQSQENPSDRIVLKLRKDPESPRWKSDQNSFHRRNGCRSWNTRHIPPLMPPPPPFPSLLSGGPPWACEWTNPVNFRPVHNNYSHGPFT